MTDAKDNPYAHIADDTFAAAPRRDPAPCPVGGRLVVEGPHERVGGEDHVGPEVSAKRDEARDVASPHRPDHHVAGDLADIRAGLIASSSVRR